MEALVNLEPCNLEEDLFFRYLDTGASGIIYFDPFKTSSITVPNEEKTNMNIMMGITIDAIVKDINSQSLYVLNAEDDAYETLKYANTSFKKYVEENGYDLESIIRKNVIHVIETNGKKLLN